MLCIFTIALRSGLGFVENNQAITKSSVMQPHNSYITNLKESLHYMIKIRLKLSVERDVIRSLSHSCKFDS